jgi:hypothetical protein
VVFNAAVLGEKQMEVDAARSQLTRLKGELASRTQDLVRSISLIYNLLKGQAREIFQCLSKNYKLNLYSL